MSLPVLGIDVAKLTLDVALLREQAISTKRFENSARGFALLQAWLNSCQAPQVHACLEATGAYSEAIALFLHEQGHLVSVLNPLRIKGYASSKLQRHKTDRTDARLIADFGSTQEPPLWTPPPPEIRHLQALTRRIAALEEMKQMELNRRDGAPPALRPSLQRMIEALEQEIARLRQQIKDHLDQHPDLKAQDDLLQTIPGIGEKTALLLLSEIEFSRYGSARQVAAAVGVTPRRRESGTSLKQTNLSKLGPSRVRRGLYFPAIVATHHNELIKEFADRLRANGKTSMQIVCAVMRKLLHQAYGVLKHRRPYDPNLAFAG